MALAALALWAVQVMGGLYMLAVWLIEHDVTNRDKSPSRLPVPVLFGHLSLAVTGLAVWVMYLLLDVEVLAWAAFYALLAIVLLGATMFARWIPVYRGPAYHPPVSAAVPVPTGPRHAFAAAPASAAGEPRVYEPPPEGNFPVLLVAGHGIFAVAILAVVFLTAIGVGGS